MWANVALILKIVIVWFALGVGTLIIINAVKAATRKGY